MHNRIGPVKFLLALLAAVALSSGAATVPQTMPVDPNAPLNEAAYPAGAKIKVACVGDSITFGYGNTAPRGESNAPPAQLQRMLGPRYEVKNFGVNSLTLLNKGDKPYQKNAAFTQAKDYKPDVVIIMLGTNDTKAVNWAFKDQFETDYKDLAGQFAKLESKPRIFLCHPPIVVGAGSWGINEADILLEVPMIDAVAKELKLGVIDVHGATKGHDDAFNSDHVHPNNNGAAIIAGAYYKALTGKDYTGPSSIVAAVGTASRPATAASGPAMR